MQEVLTKQLTACKAVLPAMSKKGGLPDGLACLHQQGCNSHWQVEEVQYPGGHGWDLQGLAILIRI